MKSIRKTANSLIGILGVLFTGLLLVGCAVPPVTYEPLSGPVGGTNSPRKDVGVLHIGDQVTITYSPPEVLQPHQEAIKEDGTISPPRIEPVIAAGKTAGALQTELQEKYDKLYSNFTVTVKSSERYFYVSGEVRRPGGQPYLGETDVIKAISAAGDCTDFANTKKIQLRRATGPTQTVDYKKALRDPRYNPQVYPGDEIHVPRRWL